MQLIYVFILPFFGVILGAACSLEYVAVPELRGGSGERERHLYHVALRPGWWLELSLFERLSSGEGRGVIVIFLSVRVRTRVHLMYDSLKMHVCVHVYMYMEIYRVYDVMQTFFLI